MGREPSDRVEEEEEEVVEEVPADRPEPVEYPDDDDEEDDEADREEDVEAVSSESVLDVFWRRFSLFSSLVTSQLLPFELSGLQ